MTIKLMKPKCCILYSMCLFVHKLLATNNNVIFNKIKVKKTKNESSQKDVHKAEIVFIEDTESVTDIPPLTRKLTYTLSAPGVTRDALVSPEAVSKSQPTVCSQNQEEETNVELNVEEKKVKYLLTSIFSVNQSLI